MLKTTLKRISLALGIIITFPLIVFSLLEVFLGGPRSEKTFNSCKEILSLVPTTIGEYLRLGFYWTVCTRISPDVCFMFGSMVAHRDTIIRAGTVVGSFTILGCADIGENVLFGARVSLISGKYQHGKPHERTSEGPVSEIYDRIIIGKNSWIGQDAIIMANIGENCTVAAGSVVYKDVPNNTTVMGNPARKVSLI